MFLPSDAALGKQDFISELVKLRQITSDSPYCIIALFALAQVTKMGRANALHLNQIFIFNFFESNFLRFWWWKLLTLKTI